MIPIENLFLTLEQAKKLKELGVVQESHFYWGKYGCDEWMIVGKTTRDFYEGEDEVYSAFTIGEIVFIAAMSDFDISNDFEDIEYVIKNLNGLPSVNEIIKNGSH